MINDFLGFNPLAGTVVVLAFAAVVMATAAIIIPEDEIIISGFAVGFFGLLDGFGLGHGRHLQAENSGGRRCQWRYTHLG